MRLKADNYVDVNDGKRCLILAQVSLGKILKALRPMPRFQPEADVDSVLGEDYKHGGMLDHREYVVYRSSQVLPRYLLWYHHTERCECVRCIPKLLLPMLPTTHHPDESEVISSARVLAKPGAAWRSMANKDFRSRKIQEMMHWCAVH